MRNFKTTKNAKIVIDYQDWYYTREEVRDYFALDEFRGFIVLDGRQCDLRDIRDLPIDNEGIDYLLYRDASTEEYKQKILTDKRGFDYDERDLEYLESRWGAYARDFEIRPFYISYYGSGSYRVQFCEPHEAQGLMLIDKKKIGKAASEDITKKVFEHYIEGEFYYVQIYSGHRAFFEEGIMRDKLKKHIEYWDYEDGGTFYLTEEEARDSIDTSVRGDIIEQTEDSGFEPFELVDNK